MELSRRDGRRLRGQTIRPRDHRRFGWWRRVTTTEGKGRHGRSQTRSEKQVGAGPRRSPSCWRSFWWRPSAGHFGCGDRPSRLAGHNHRQGVDSRQVGAATATTAAGATTATRRRPLRGPRQRQAAPSARVAGRSGRRRADRQPDSAEVNLDRKVVQNAALTIEVKRDTFQRQFDAALALADTYGGYVCRRRRRLRPKRPSCGGHHHSPRSLGLVQPGAQSGLALGVVKARHIIPKTSLRSTST